MNYAKVLPSNWLHEMKKSNQAYLNRIAQVNPYHRLVRTCLNKLQPEPRCPLMRLGGCTAQHCILRYPDEKQTERFQ